MSVDPPGGVNLTLAILALVGAALSIVGFIAHYIPRHQYYNDWLLLLPSDQRSGLYQRYCRISADLESFSYLISMPSYVLVFYVRTALKLRSLRRSASLLKIEMIALSQIERGKKIKKTMEMSLSPILTSETPTVNNATASLSTSRIQKPNVPSSRRWWRSNLKTPQATTSKVPVVNDLECLPV